MNLCPSFNFSLTLTIYRVHHFKVILRRPSMNLCPSSRFCFDLDLAIKLLFTILICISCLIQKWFVNSLEPDKFFRTREIVQCHSTPCKKCEKGIKFCLGLRVSWYFKNIGINQTVSPVGIRPSAMELHH